MKPGLNQLPVVHHCPMSWAAMTGDERVRHCSHCDRSVYNVSDLTREDAETMILQHEGKACSSCFQRRDGTIVARPCRAYPRSALRLLTVVTAAAAAIALVAFPVLAQGESVTPQAKSDSLVQQNHLLGKRLRMERDPSARQALEQQREQIRERFRNNVQRLR